jgi:exopolyphosphatase/guanosine-5'-triphosphate,3'-diphosphate pyrophosphatase
LRSYGYASLPTPENWKMIRQVSTLLALAEAADVTYEHFITSVDITLVENVAAFVMTTLPGSNYSAADYEMKKLAKQFKKEFGATLMLIWK